MTPDAFKALVQAKVADNRTAFEGLYKHELNQLMGFSQEDIDSITPDTTDLEAYDNLITTVKPASQQNISQAQLEQEIEALGSVAVKIAEKIPSLLT